MKLALPEIEEAAEEALAVTAEEGGLKLFKVFNFKPHIAAAFLFFFCFFETYHSV